MKIAHHKVVVAEDRRRRGGSGSGQVGIVGFAVGRRVAVVRQARQGGLQLVAGEAAQDIGLHPALSRVQAKLMIPIT